MRRAQSVRHYTRANTSSQVDDLGVVAEILDEAIETTLRRQLLEKDREVDKLKVQVMQLQEQLSRRPSIERVQAVEKEYAQLDILLQGTQRENEKSMAELNRLRDREKVLEKELEHLVGPDWQASLNIASSSAFVSRPGAVGSPAISSSLAAFPTAATASEGALPATAEATLAHVEQVRLLILGMEQRLQLREEKLVKSIEKAEAEGSKFEEIRKQVMSTPP